jgi:predicted Zn-dependent protease
MKRAILLLTAAAIPALLLNAQFGGIINRAKDRIDQGKQKAKPVTERAERAVDNFTLWTPEEEQQIGEATAAKMIAMFGNIDTPKLVRYVNLVGQSVAQYAPRQVPYRFGILDSEIVGAFALPRRLHLHHQDGARGDDH